LYLYEPGGKLRAVALTRKEMALFGVYDAEGRGGVQMSCGEADRGFWLRDDRGKVRGVLLLRNGEALFRVQDEHEKATFGGPP